MNAMARRGIVCWLGLSLCAVALYGQETTGEKPKPSEPQNRNAQNEEEKAAFGVYPEEYVRKLTAEFKARALDFEKMQAQLQKAEAEKQSLAAELEKLRQIVEGMATQKNAVEERARKQVDELAAKLRETMARDYRTENANRANQFAYVDDMKRAADALATRRVEEAASKLDEARPDPTRNEVEEGWKRLLERADMMLEKSRLNDELAAKYMPKLESAVTQLRKAGRNHEADELLAVAGSALGRGMPSPNVPRDNAPPEHVRRDARNPHDPRASGDVRQAIDELRREVEQLRGEVGELRQLFERGNARESNRRERNDAHERRDERGERSDARSGASDLVGVHSRHPGEVLRVGDASRSVRVGDRVSKGELLAVIRSTENTGETKREFILGAPADGRIVERRLSVGEIVDPGDVLFQIEVDGSNQAKERR